MKVEVKKSALYMLAIALVSIFALFFLHTVSSPKEAPILHRVEGALAYVSVPELFQDASLIVEGTVVGNTDAFRIESVSGNFGNYTDYQFQINSVLRGEPANGADSVDIRVQGGTVGNVTEEYSGSPEFEVGENYLVFLYQPGRGGSFNTEGDYYYVLGLCQGVFAKDENEQYLSQSGEKLTDDYLIQPINDVPVDPDHFRNEYIENQRRNLENGFLTQEEFDQLMRDIDVYAEIVS